MNFLTEEQSFKIIRYFTFFGNFLPQFCLCMLLLAIDFDKGIEVGGIWGMSYAVNLLIKMWVKKKRPDESLWKVKNVTGSSFPSGHSLTSMTFYWSIAKYFEIAFPWAIIFYLMPFGLGLSRLYLRVHYPEDVYCGWLIAYIYMQTFSFEAIAISQFIAKPILEPIFSLF